MPLRTGLGGGVLLTLGGLGTVGVRGGGGGGGEGGGFLLGLGLRAALLALDGGLLGVLDLGEGGAGLEGQGGEDGRGLGALGTVGDRDDVQLAVLAHLDQQGDGLQQKLLVGLLDLLDLLLRGLLGLDLDATGGESGGKLLGGESGDDGVDGGGGGFHCILLVLSFFV